MHIPAPNMSAIPDRSAILPESCRTQINRLLQNGKAFAVVSLPRHQTWCLGSGILRKKNWNTDSPELEHTPHFLVHTYEELVHNSADTKSSKQNRKSSARLTAWEFSDMEMIVPKEAPPVPTTRTQSAAAWPEGSEAFGSFKTYAKNVGKIQDKIRGGELYQLNYTLASTGPGKPQDIARMWFSALDDLRAPYASLFYDGTRLVASLSPEELLTIHQDQITSSPIKGTKTPSQELQSSKHEGEHTMIVDLLRNDLGRVCVADSISVDPFKSPVRFTAIEHLVSTVRGTIRQDVSYPDLVRALMPGGSITGAPKSSSIEAIRTIEKQDRNEYCGALGVYLSADSVSISIPIRTCYQEGDFCTVHSGGGIVIDSVPEQEWEEITKKMYWIRK